ncbi:MAG TPA: cell wall-binding repeat-containing protein, partial [Nitriliruptorales bacterium]
MREQRSVPVVVLAALLILVPVAAVAATFDGDPSTTERVDAADPTSAAIQISQARFAADAAAHVVLSRDDNFPDSLAGSALTATGPLLLTATSSLTPSSRTELERVLPDGAAVYLLGGPVAIADAVEAQIKAMGYAPK